MTKTKRILSVVGTRPEAIKMAPVIQKLENAPWATSCVLCTGQHQELVRLSLAAFQVKIDVSMHTMLPGQSLAVSTGRLLVGMDEVMSELGHFDAVLAQGDTNTVLAAALIAFYHRVPFGHIEAGLRTHDLYSPFPEEMNRLVVSRLARWHFVPTETAKANLLREGIGAEHILVTGNTGIDALLDIVRTSELPPDINIDKQKKCIVVTAHRRENFGEPMARIVAAIDQIAREHPDVQIIFPVHPNPAVKKAVSILEGRDNIILSAPLSYVHFVALMAHAYLLLTDSGGVQEEAPALCKPVLVMRESTERPEAVHAGVARLVGNQTHTIVQAVNTLLTDHSAYQSMARGGSPYGDGYAAQRIVEYLEQSLTV